MDVDGDYEFIESNGKQILVDKKNQRCFHKNGARNGRAGYRCRWYQKDGVRCDVRVSESDGEFVHNGKRHKAHPNDEQYILKKRVLGATKRRAREEGGRLHRIYAEEVRREPGADPVYSHHERTLQRQRALRQPPVPHTLDEAEQSIIERPFYKNNSSGTRPFYSGRVSVGEQTALIFISLALIPALVDSTEIHMDATFKVAPRLFYQLMILHTVAFDHLFPVVYAFMTGKSKRLYQSVLNHLNGVALQSTGRRPDPQLLISDFETSIMEAFASVYDGRVRGCWFHFNQAILKKVRNLGLKRPFDTPNSPVNNTVRMLFSLALLDPARAPIGLQTARTYWENYQGPSPRSVIRKMERLFRYMESYWFNVITPERFCVYQDNRRTNSEVESFHSRLNRDIGVAHPNFHKCIEHLQDFERIEEIGYTKVSTENICRPTKKATRERNAKIERNIRLLNEGRWTLQEFLLSCGRHYIVPTDVEGEDDIEDEDLDEEERRELAADAEADEVAVDHVPAVPIMEEEDQLQQQPPAAEPLPAAVLTAGPRRRGRPRRAAVRAAADAVDEPLPVANGARIRRYGLRPQPRPNPRFLPEPLDQLPPAVHAPRQENFEDQALEDIRLMEVEIDQLFQELRDIPDHGPELGRERPPAPPVDPAPPAVVPAPLQPDVEPYAGPNLCPVCMFHKMNRRLNCGHVVCAFCAEAIRNVRDQYGTLVPPTCPVCRQRYTEALPIFLPD